MVVLARRRKKIEWLLEHAQYGPMGSYFHSTDKTKKKGPRHNILEVYSFQVSAAKILLNSREHRLEEGFLEGCPQFTHYPQNFSITTSKWIFLLVNVY